MNPTDTAEAQAPDAAESARTPIDIDVDRVRWQCEVALQLQYEIDRYPFAPDVRAAVVTTLVGSYLSRF